ncbi:MAG: hypothetical protein FJ150_05985 [Euryarchaeota archaeon]|nr:hypothetical protein [Euryarchaeota archaeon]
MKDGKCPKCGSENVYTHDTGISYDEDEIYIYLDGTICEYDSYICTECGYFENYIREKDIRGVNVFEKVAQEWDKVGW